MMAFEFFPEEIMGMTDAKKSDARFFCTKLNSSRMTQLWERNPFV